MPRLPIQIALILVASVAGFAAYRGLASRPTAAPIVAQAPVALASAAPASAATPTAEETPKRVIPDTVPEVSLADLAGRQYSLKTFAGKPTVFNFWATWCVPCLREIPLLNSLAKAHAEKNLQIVGIAVDFKDDVNKYVQTNKLDYPLLVGEQDGIDAANRFGMEMALPFSVFVDSSERILAVKVGELHQDEADSILATLYAVDAGQMALAQAKTAIGAKLRELALGRSAR
jgi:thiol-disulfide isomerase/thioredoxin